MAKTTRRLSSPALVAVALLALSVMVAVFAYLRSPQPPAAADGTDLPASRTAPSSPTSTADRRLQRERNAAKNPSVEGDGNLDRIRQAGTYEHALAGDLALPFDGDELARLADRPGSDVFRLAHLIGRAAAEKDSRFRYLLNREDLREKGETAPMLAVYDYAVNGNQAALDGLLAKLTAEGSGWDSWPVTALNFVDEWDRTKTALESHTMSGDGSGGDSRYAFWLARRSLFPQDKSFPTDYAQFEKDLIAQQQLAPQRDPPPDPPASGGEDPDAQ